MDIFLYAIPSGTLLIAYLSGMSKTRLCKRWPHGRAQILKACKGIFLLLRILCRVCCHLETLSAYIGSASYN